MSAAAADDDDGDDIDGNDDDDDVKSSLGQTLKESFKRPRQTTVSKL